MIVRNSGKPLTIRTHGSSLTLPTGDTPVGEPLAFHIRGIVSSHPRLSEVVEETTPAPKPEKKKKKTKQEEKSGPKPEPEPDPIATPPEESKPDSDEDK